MPEVVLVHRLVYGDWTFPKGKLDRGESLEAAALREVEEETGLACRLGRKLGQTRYRNGGGRPKVVTYWEMTVVSGVLVPDHEIDDATWASREDAARLLSYQRDRDLLAKSPWPDASRKV